ncbi:hypothetical protein [Phreatobacter sp.]|uniref:hypothetical protein n=1 Tax=Phreatobacter sp. TaxID=1966341 RepID=UPI003F6FBE23
MIRFSLRFTGFLIVAFGFVLAVIDGTRSIAGQTLLFTSLSESWRAVHPRSLVDLEQTLAGRGLDWLWDPVMLVMLALPMAALALVFGALLMALGRKREPRIGVIGRR